MRQPNAITNARYGYTTIEKRVIYHAVVALQNEIGIVQAPDLFNKHLAVNIPYRRLKAWDMNDNMSRDLRNAVKSLRKKDYEIKTEDGWIDTGFITYATYSEKEGLYIEVSKALVPALLEVSRGFTPYNAVVALSLQSKYSQRFYEWCCQWKDTGWFEFTPDKLNDVLLTNLVTGALKDRVISVAQKELDELYRDGQCDVYFTVKEERGGKGRGGGLKKWRFNVHHKDSGKALPNATGEDYLYVMDFLKKSFGPTKKDLINKAANQILGMNCVKAVAERFEKIVPNKIQNMGGYVRKLLKEEFEIAV